VNSHDQTKRTDTVRQREPSMPDAREIAKAEMVRRRRRLGTLTRNQEIAIENLLMFTVNRISELVARALEA
jgi:hypothetical protein